MSESIKSKYLSIFNSVPLSLLPQVSGNRMLIELLPKEELKTAGGLLLATVSTHKSDIEWLRPKLGVVLIKGGGVINEQGTYEAIPFKVGAVCLVSEHAPKSMSTFPGLEGIVTDEVALINRFDVHMSWDSIDTYVEYRNSIRVAK